MRPYGVLVTAISVVVALAGCAAPAQPRQRPIPTSPINEGADTMSAVRQQLQGRWELLSLNVNGADGSAHSVDATGVLTSDAFGSLQIEYRMSEAGMQALAAIGIKYPNPVVSTSGRVVIDPQKKQITYVGDDFNQRALGGDKELAAQRANPFALERARFYAFSISGELTLSTRYDDGKDALVSRWKKSS